MFLEGIVAVRIIYSIIYTHNNIQYIITRSMAVDAIIH